MVLDPLPVDSLLEELLEDLEEVTLPVPEVHLLELLEVKNEKSQDVSTNIDNAVSKIRCFFMITIF